MELARIPFTEYDEAAIRGAARWGTIVGYATIAAAIISCALSTWINVLVGFEPGDVIDLVVAAGEVLLNVWLLSACRSFQLVANTDEADQAHLLSGFRNLRLYVMGQVVFIALGVVGTTLFVALFWSSL